MQLQLNDTVLFNVWFVYKTDNVCFVVYLYLMGGGGLCFFILFLCFFVFLFFLSSSFVVWPHVASVSVLLILDFAFDFF